MKFSSYFLLCIGLHLFFSVVFGSKTTEKKLTFEDVITIILYTFLTTFASWYCLKISLPELITYLTKL
ncbi:MAG: hypothetical protein ACRC8M_13865 [Cetobacterium sp.]|uniref:hypothetical protein n=1 Tax=Cetobacterium sp. TaxID=2071632 RepID=UPI003F3E05EB